MAVAVLVAVVVAVAMASFLKRLLRVLIVFLTLALFPISISGEKKEAEHE